MFGKIIAFDKYPANYQDILDIFFHGKRTISITDKFEPERQFKINLVRWARLIFKELFKGKNSLTEEEMTKLVKSAYFKERPLYRDFTHDNYLESVKFFEAEDKAAKCVVKKFVRKNKDKVFTYIDYDRIWRYEIYRCTDDDNASFIKILESFSSIDIGGDIIT
jgi:hypothetical protein